MPSKAKEISETLRAEILKGKFDVSRRLPSEHQLMRRFSVARETVRAAIKELAKSELVESRPGYGTFLADFASSKAQRKFAVIVPDAFHPFYSSICQGIEEGAKKQDWNILAASIGAGAARDRAVKAMQFAEVCRNEKVGGVFYEPIQFLNDSSRINAEILSLFDEAKIPVVLLDSDFVPPPLRSRYDLVGVDNANVGYTLARHMIERGAKRIVYFSNPSPAPTSLMRANGVGMAVTESGLKLTRDNILFANPMDEAAAKRFFASKKRPDAIIAVNDLIAAYLLRTLNAIGLDVPNDVMLAGVNGDAESENAPVPITTALQPTLHIGRAAVGVMLSRLADPGIPAQEILMSTRILPRQSTAPSRNSAER